MVVLVRPMTTPSERVNEIRHQWENEEAFHGHAVYRDAAWLLAHVDALTERLVRAEHGVSIPASAEQLNNQRDQIQTLTERLREAEREHEIDQERISVAAKMRRYIAFVLTGDEEADAQLAADRAHEALAGAHAIRCTCDGATRDARCVELQGVALKKDL